MGYRSDVAVVLKQNDYNKLTELANVDGNGIKNLLSESDSKRMLFDGHEYYYLLSWKNIKWYDLIDEDIIVFMQFLDGLDESEYDFIRLGEEFDDNEFRLGLGIIYPEKFISVPERNILD